MGPDADLILEATDALLLRISERAGPVVFPNPDPPPCPACGTAPWPEPEPVPWPEPEPEPEPDGTLF